MLQPIRKIQGSNHKFGKILLFYFLSAVIPTKERTKEEVIESWKDPFFGMKPERNEASEEKAKILCASDIEN